MIRIEVESTVASGDYTANAYREGEIGLLASAAHATRQTAIANVLTALGAHPTGDLRTEPISIVTPRPRNVV